MKVHFIILTYIWLSYGLHGKAQNTNFYWGEINQNSNRLEGKLRGTRYNLTPHVDRNFFMQKDWAKGTIYTEDGDTFNNIKLRYQAREDQLVAINDNLINFFVVDKETVKGFTLHLEDEEQEFVKLYFDGMTKGFRYFQKLYSGPASLLAFRFIEEIKTTPFRDEQGIKRDTQCKLTVFYYCYSSESGFIKIQKRKKAFLKLYPDQKPEIRRLFRSNNLTNFDEESLVKAFKLLDGAGILN